MSVRWNRRSYTREQFTEAWNSSESISEVAQKLGRNRSGGGFYSIRSAAKDLGLLESHMSGGYVGNPSGRGRVPLEAVLVESSSYSNTNSLKKRLYAEGLLEKRCSTCGITEWQGNPAPLALDHVNGVRSDNRIENLRILCYNCHGQTDTFGGKKNKLKVGDVSFSKGRPFVVGICPSCGAERWSASRREKCAVCRERPTKIDWPSVEELVERLNNEYVRDIAGSLGVSDSALKKHLKCRGAWTPRKKGPKKKI